MNKEQEVIELLEKAIYEFNVNWDNKYTANKMFAPIQKAIALLNQPECKTCGGSKRKPREKHCKLAHCVKKHARITCRPNGKDCEHYIPSEPCPDCEKPVNSPPTSKEKTAPIIKPETGAKKGEVASQPPISMKVAVDDCDITDKPPGSEFFPLTRKDMYEVIQECCGLCPWCVGVLGRYVKQESDRLDKAESEKESIQKLYDNTMKSLFSTEQRIKDLEELNDTVQVNCHPPNDCNDPVVLKTYMKACFDKAIRTSN